jgi:sterol desaturase/sphingolipid hydroxylase (fatty acid hydroxylase superfamily)
MSLLFDRALATAPTLAERWRRRAVALLAFTRVRLYVPACLITVSAAILIGLGWANRWGGESLGGTMASLRVVLIGPATLAVLAALLIAERIWPAQRGRSLLARGHRQDLMYTVFNATLVLPFAAALSLSFSELIRAHLPWLTFPRIATLPHLAVIAALFIAMDGCNWFAHWANHRVRVLWRFHELHHSQEDMNVLTVFRTHPFVHVVYLVALLPGLVLLSNGVLSTTLLIVYAAIVALAHSNIRLSFGPLDRIVVSPNFHRLHHRAQGRQDVNLGFALTIWDQLFCRAVFPSRATVGITTGLPGRPLAVEFGGELPRHFAVFGAQLLAPFRPVRARNDGFEVNSDSAPTTEH